MFSFPTQLVSHKYYQLLDINSKSTTKDIFEAIKKLYHEYHKTQFNIDILFQQILSLSICYDILNDPGKKDLYDTYGDYLFDKLITPEHYNNKLINYIFQNSNEYEEPLFIELPLEKLNSGDVIPIEYQIDNYSKKSIELDIIVPKRSKNNDLITTYYGKTKISIFLKQQQDSRFFVFGNNLLSKVKISMYDILLHRKQVFSNFYGNKININLDDIHPWSILKYENHGLFSNIPKTKNNLFIVFNILGPEVIDYHTRLYLELLEKKEYPKKDVDYISLIELLFKNFKEEKITPKFQQETTLMVQNILISLKKDTINNKHIIYKKLIFYILKDLICK